MVIVPSFTALRTLKHWLWFMVRPPAFTFDLMVVVMFSFFDLVSGVFAATLAPTSSGSRGSHRSSLLFLDPKGDRSRVASAPTPSKNGRTPSVPSVRSGRLNAVDLPVYTGVGYLE